MNNKNKQKKRAGRPIGRILFGIFCFLLLTVLLYITQLFVSLYMNYDNTMLELEQVQARLNAQPHQDEIQEGMEEFCKQNVQKAILLLSGDKLSSEKLADVIENQIYAEGMAVFREDGSRLYASGKVTDDPDFLSRLLISGNEKAENGIFYLSVPLHDDLHLVVSFDLTLLESYNQSWGLEGIEEFAAGMSGELIIVNRKNDRVLYGLDSMIGKKMTDYLPVAVDGEFVVPMMVIDNSIYLYDYLEHEDYLLLSAFDFVSLIMNLKSTVMPALWGFGALIFFLLAYTEFIRTDMGMGRLGKIHYVQLSRKRYLNTMLLRKLSGFALIGITCMICITYCLQMLIRSDEQRQEAEHRLDIAARLVEENQANLTEIEKQDRQYLVEMAKEIKSTLSFDQKLLSAEGLDSVSRLYSVGDIILLNEAGKMEVSSTGIQDFMISSNMADDTYAFWNVINGFAESHVQVVKNDPHSGERDMVYIGIPDFDNRGLIMVTYPYETFKAWQQMYDVDIALYTVSLDSQSLLLAVKAGSTDCVFDSSGQYTGQTLDAYGINAEFLRNGYSGTHRFDDENCLITTRSVLDWNLIYVTPTGWISAGSWMFTAMVILTGLLVAVIAVLPWIVVGSPGEDLRVPASKEQAVHHRSHVNAILNRDGQIEIEENQVEQYTFGIRWKRMNAGMKLSYLIRTVLLAGGCCLVFFLLFGVYSEEDMLIERIMEQNWDKSLNVYALSYVAIVLAGIWFVAKILQSITLFVTGTFSRRWKTFGILISNIIRYAALIASIFFSLQNVGVETSALITSASVLTLVFGLGCQSFVADMVAGVFLIFEGTFRVGDIVTVDNWRGEVVEIGLRSTNVKNELGNVKVFQNSRISGAINMTRDLTYAVCDIILPPGEPLEAYEEKLTKDFFPLAAQSIRSIRQPLVYEGVVAMNGDSATLRISVKCLESEREQIRRDLYRTLKLWREQNR